MLREKLLPVSFLGFSSAQCLANSLITCTSLAELATACKRDARRCATMSASESNRKLVPSAWVHKRHKKAMRRMIGRKVLKAWKVEQASEKKQPEVS